MDENQRLDFLAFLHKVYLFYRELFILELPFDNFVRQNLENSSANYLQISFLPELMYGKLDIVFFQHGIEEAGIISGK